MENYTNNLTPLDKQELDNISGGSDVLEDIWYGIGYFAREGWEWTKESHPSYGF